MWAFLKMNSDGDTCSPSPCCLLVYTIKMVFLGGGELRFMIGAQKPLNDMKHKNYIGKGEVASSDDF